MAGLHDPLYHVGEIVLITGGYFVGSIGIVSDPLSHYPTMIANYYLTLQTYLIKLPDGNFTWVDPENFQIL